MACGTFSVSLFLCRVKRACVQPIALPVWHHSAFASRSEDSNFSCISDLPHHSPPQSHSRQTAFNSFSHHHPTSNRPNYDNMKQLGSSNGRSAVSTIILDISPPKLKLSLDFSYPSHASEGAAVRAVNRVVGMNDGALQYCTRFIL